MKNLVELTRQELSVCNGGSILGGLALAGIFIGGAAGGTAITVGIVNLCKKLNF